MNVPQDQLTVPQEDQHLGLVSVRLFPGDPPYARPDPCGAWVHSESNRTDTVVFSCRESFTISFPSGSPFDVDPLHGELRGGIYVAYGKIKQDAYLRGGDAIDGHKDMKAYKYTLEVAGQVSDPDVVVKKDPREPGN